MSKEKHISGIKWLAIYQIAGGVLGIAFMGDLIFTFKTSDSLYDLLIVSGLLLYSFSIYCGIILFKSQSNSLIMSLICQCFQAVSFSFFGFSYKFISGFLYGVVLESSDSLHIYFNITLSSFSFRVGTNDVHRNIGFNLVAIGMIIVLSHMIKSIDLEKKEDLIDSIGS